MENSEKFAHIKGWGVDANPKNEPTYPIKNYTGDDHKRLNYERPPMQGQDVEILHSNERPGASAVFGTSVPPSGLSGRIRRFAFKYGEGSYGHWLPLILADRVNVAEGYVGDLRRGYFPNLFAELGGHAAWKYNRKGLIRKAVVGAIVSTAAILLVAGLSSKSRQKG